MAAAFIDPIIIEQNYTWEVNFDVKSSGTARSLSGWTGYLTASGIMLTAATLGTAGRVTFSLTSAQTSGYNFDRIGYEVKLISGVTAEKMAVGTLVLATAIR